MVRTQAAFHSVLVMCVSRSQNPMQSASDLPPPPGALGADSLGLAEEEAPGDSAILGCTTPPVANCVCSCGESGGRGASSGMGAAIADGGVTASGGGRGGVVPIPELSKAAAAAAADVLPFLLVVPAGLCTDCGVRAIACDVTVLAAGEGVGSPATGCRRILAGSPVAGCSPERPAPGEGVVAICEAGVIDRATAPAWPPPLA